MLEARNGGYTAVTGSAPATPRSMGSLKGRTFTVRLSELTFTTLAVSSYGKVCAHIDGVIVPLSMGARYLYEGSYRDCPHLNSLSMLAYKAGIDCHSDIQNRIYAVLDLFVNAHLITNEERSQIDVADDKVSHDVVFSLVIDTYDGEDDRKHYYCTARRV